MILFEIFKMNCGQATLLVQKKMHGKIGPMERLGLWLHAVRCSFCRLFFKQSELISKEATKLDKTGLTLDPVRKEKMMEVLKTKFKE
jgi:hypothetical protein